MAWNIEVTDTFGGEANYCWVRRYRMPDVSGGQASIVRRAKRLADWLGLRCKTTAYGDTYEVRPVGRNAPCIVMFITWVDHEER